MSTTEEKAYQNLLETGLTEDHIRNLVKEKVKEYDGFISEQGALFLVAKEKGLRVRSKEVDETVYEEIEREIDYNDFTIDISLVCEGMKNIVLTGRVIKIFETRNFTRKDGTSGVVGSFLIRDNSGTIKIVLWDNVASVIKTDYFRTGEIVMVVDGYSKIGLNDSLEVHLSKKGKIIIAPKDTNKREIPPLKDDDTEEIKELDKIDRYSKIKDLFDNEGFIGTIEGFVKIKEFKEIDLESGEKTFLLKFSLADETASILVIAWGMKAVNCLKILNNGDKIKLSGTLIKLNTYTNEKELHFSKKSTLTKINV
ncbi:MAG: hypothetical protein ACTSRI_20375 [Promethearchaeota archaeon]